jgi:hypothetical protein
MVILSLIMWVLYRRLFIFPVWFDETLGKAVFFGLPVMLYVGMTGEKAISDSFSFEKIKPGLLQGIAFGGLFGFAASIVQLVSSGDQVQASVLFAANSFWQDFLMALMTGFWETVFFFSFVMTVIQIVKKNWSLVQQVMLTSLVFMIFHLPNILLRFSGSYIIGYIILLSGFAVGQAFIYSRRQNGYTLVLSHAIWGMVLLEHVLR